MLSQFKLFKPTLNRVTLVFLFPIACCLVSTAFPPIARSQPSQRIESQQRSPATSTANKELVEQVFQSVEKDYLDSTFNWQDWQAIRRRYLSRTYPSRKDAYAAIRATLKGLGDDFTQFLDPDEYKALQIDDKNAPSKIGIGLELKLNEATKRLEILRVLEGSTAQAAGILNGDVLLQINERRTQGMSAMAAVSILQDKVGTPVSVIVQRGRQKLTFRITRIAFEIKEVEFRSQNSAIGKVGYIRLYRFSARSPDQMRKAIRALEQESVVGYVLDVRGNGGGLLYTGVDIARMWLNDGLLVWMVDRGSKPEKERANRTALTQKPTVVLVDNGTAAASEILAGALQDHQRAALVGTPTAGANLIQSIRSLKGDSGLKMTIAKWLTPSGRDIRRTGLTPDQTVTLSAAQQRTLRQSSQFGTAADPQYAKAIEVMAKRRVSSTPQTSKIEATGAAKIEADLLLREGFQQYQTSRFDAALRFWQRALDLYVQVGDQRGAGRAKGGLGLAYRDLGDYDKAAEYFQDWLTIAQKLPDRQEMGRALNSLGSVYSSLKDYKKAISVYERALDLTLATNDQPEKARVAENLGVVYRELGNAPAAINHIQQALTLVKSFKDRQAEGRVLGNLGTAYSLLGSRVQAITLQQQSFAIAQETGDRQGQGTALSRLGLTLYKFGNLEPAKKTLFVAIDILESVRRGLGDDDFNKVSIFETQAATYQTLQSVLVEQHETGTALEVAERGRARAFVEILAKRLSTDQPVTVNTPSSSPPTLQQIKQIAKDQNATLVQYSLVNDAVQVQGKPAPRQSKLYIWVIQPTGDIRFRQVDLKPLWQRYNASLDSLIIGNQEFLAVRSRSANSTKPQPDLPTLHQLLIKPIASLLPKNPNDRVIFIPQGALFQVPFPALQDDQGNYLIQKHTILTAPSIQVLALTRQQRQKLASQPNRKQALVLGNPTMPALGIFQQPLPALPGAEAEAKAIASLLNTQAIVGAQGTKALIKQRMTQASMIHLATHGYLDDVRGLGSAIALAPSGQDNGWLTAEEILGMKLQANLVVLSACNTAEGRITGDGVIGLSRSLISAGVPSVIVSLWAVPDAPTAALMRSFYQNLQQNPDKAQALRQAMLTTMKRHPQPRDWAAFTLIGEAE